MKRRMDTILRRSTLLAIFRDVRRTDVRGSAVRRSAVRLSLAALVAAAVFGGTVAKADTVVFDLNQTVPDHFGNAGFGLAQGVIVSKTTLIDGFAFRLGSSGPVTYSIWNGSATSQLYTHTFQASATSPTWVEDSSLFTLNAGSEYLFALTVPALFDFGVITTPYAYSANGLTADVNNLAFFNGVPSPKSTFTGQVGLELFTATPTGVAPEPGSLVLLGTGVVAAAGAFRRRLGC